MACIYEEIKLTYILTEILNNFITEDNNNFLRLKEYFKQNALMFQYVYSTLFPKYFCRVDDYSKKNKLAFGVAHADYQNQKENFRLLRLQQRQQIVSIKQEQIDENETIEFKVIDEKLDPLLVPLKTKKRKIVLKNKTKKEMRKKQNF